MKHWLILPN